MEPTTSTVELAAHPTLLSTATVRRDRELLGKVHLLQG